MLSFSDGTFFFVVAIHLLTLYCHKQLLGGPLALDPPLTPFTSLRVSAQHHGDYHTRYVSPSLSRTSGPDGRSPLFALSPCKACSTGWTASPSSINASSTATYGWTTHNTSSIELNFTGTAISFSLSYPSSVSSWTTKLSINGSSVSNTSQATTLPWGSHHAILDLQSPTGSDEWARFDNATITLGSLIGAGTRNGTVDDSAWRSENVTLSPGWNMMEQGESNWLNQVSLPMDPRPGRRIPCLNPVDC
jgi:hypothetical protein